ncbi:MAG TPA: N-acetylmuramoyl-L-alanine amidase, partial [Candidatus Krumholzibacteria bacterium]|nr:N-acetylmuramoyl-L-alanine amidase [Candidatus Krumholzibacteria bacterium]
DVALRVAVLLKLHGASVTITLLSPNHLLRGNEPPTATFVHDRNEVFNDEAWNRRNRPQAWPRGGQEYLDRRIAVARDALRGVPDSRQVFLSFHADNDPTAGDAVTLFYYQDRHRTDTVSRSFARSLLPAMGAGARIKGRSLGVLRNNPARWKLLVEMRNLAYPEHVWALRRPEMRQRDAEKVVRALMDAAAGR